MPVNHRESRSLRRRGIYLGEGLTFDVRSGGGRLAAEAIDLTSEGVGLALVEPPVLLPAVGEAVTVRYTGRGASGAERQAIVRHVGSLSSARRVLPRIGLSLAPAAALPAGVRYACPLALPAFATATSPLFFREQQNFRILDVGADGITLQPAPGALLLEGLELGLDLHLAQIGVVPARGRLISVRRDAIDVTWIDPPRPLLHAISHYVLAGDDTQTPAALRASGLKVGSIERAVTYDHATSSADLEEILALRLRAHQAEGHLMGASNADLRSPFDAHARHLTCRFGRRIVGYVRVIFVDGVPARSQYVSWGGHEVPPWLWRAGFVEAGAGAVHPDFQRAGLFVPLMQHSLRVAVQSKHRYVLGACDDGLLSMYREMGYEVLEQRTVEPKPGWSFRSHLIYTDAERLVQDLPASKTLAAMASAIAFAA